MVTARKVVERAGTPQMYSQKYNIVDLNVFVIHEDAISLCGNQKYLIVMNETAGIYSRL